MPAMGVGGGLLVAFAGLAQAQTPAACGRSLSAAAASAPQWVVVPRATGRLRAPDIGLVINSADPYSVAVGRLLPAAAWPAVRAGAAGRTAAAGHAQARRVRGPACCDRRALRPGHAGAGPGLEPALCGGVQFDHRRVGAGLRCRPVPPKLCAVACVDLCQLGLGAALARPWHAPVDAAGGARRGGGATPDRPRCRGRPNAGPARRAAGAGLLPHHPRQRPQRARAAVSAGRPAAARWRAGQRAGGSGLERHAPCAAGPDRQRAAAHGRGHRMAGRRAGRPPHLLRRAAGPRHRPGNGAGLDRLRRDRQPRRRQRALQPPAEVSASAVAAAALPAGQHRHRGLLEERAVAAAVAVRRRAAGRAASRGVDQPSASAASRPERTAPSSVAG